MTQPTDDFNLDALDLDAAEAAAQEKAGQGGEVVEDGADCEGCKI